MTVRKSPSECLIGDAVMHRDILALYAWAGVEAEAPGFPDVEGCDVPPTQFLGAPGFKFSARTIHCDRGSEPGWVRES